MRSAYVIQFLTIVIFTINVSCNGTLSEPPKSHTFAAFLEEADIDPANEPKAYLIFPLDGCSGCITQSIEFAKENIANQEVTFIISENSMKKVKMNFPNVDLDAPNIHIDTGRVAFHAKILDGTYPSLYYVEDGGAHRMIPINGTNITAHLDSLQKVIARN